MVFILLSICWSCVSLGLKVQDCFGTGVLGVATSAAVGDVSAAIGEGMVIGDGLSRAAIAAKEKGAEQAVKPKE